VVFCVTFGFLGVLTRPLYIHSSAKIDRITSVLEQIGGG